MPYEILPIRTEALRYFRYTEEESRRVSSTLWLRIPGISPASVALPVKVVEKKHVSSKEYLRHGRVFHLFSRNLYEAIGERMSVFGAHTRPNKSEPGSSRSTSFLEPPQVKQLLAGLSEPCRTVVLTAILTSLRIGEVLALRWSRLDFVRNSIEVSETYSDGKFGSPKPRSSRRVIPMSQTLCEVLKTHRASCIHSGKLPRVSWHSFRHGNAALLGEVGESVKTAQAILGHSDIETTLNTYMHAIPDSQRRAVERVAGVLFPGVPKLAAAEQNQNCGSNHEERS